MQCEDRPAPVAIPARSRPSFRRRAVENVANRREAAGGIPPSGTVLKLCSTRSSPDFVTTKTVPSPDLPPRDVVP